MRPIKFRAWNKHSKKMFNVLEIWFKENTTHPNGPIGALIDTSPYAVFCEFDVLEIMQFTGLHDNNGKEIWEGDVVERQGGYRSERGVVFWYELCSAWGWSNKNSVGTFVEQFRNKGTGEVLGNIYENPELLK